MSGLDAHPNFCFAYFPITFQKFLLNWPASFMTLFPPDVSTLISEQRIEVLLNHLLLREGLSRHRWVMGNFLDIYNLHWFLA